MTIKTLNYQRLPFPEALSSRLAEMVKTGPVMTKKTGASLLADFVPKLTFINDSLLLLESVIESEKRVERESTRVKDALSYIRSVEQLSDTPRSEMLREKINELNKLRTGFIDHFFKDGVLADETLSAVKTIHLDIPELVQASRWLAAGVIHPALENDTVLMAETYANLERARDQNYHRHFDQHCPNFRKLKQNDSLLPPDNGDIVPTANTELSWVDEYLEKDKLDALMDYLPSSVKEGVSQILSQFIALEKIEVTDKTVGIFISQVQPILAAAWDRIVEQTRLLLFLVERYITIVELSHDIYAIYLNTKIAEITDDALRVAVWTGLKPVKREQ